MKKKNNKAVLAGKGKAGYAAQDFEEGRAGGQSINPGNFTQFHNNGNGGFAATHTANSKDILQRQEKNK